MSTRLISELTEKRHPDVKRDVENMLSQLDLDVSSFAHIYIDTQNRKQTEYLLDEDLTMTLVTGYNVVLRNRVIKRWKELEGQQITLPDFTNPAVAAMAWAEQYQSQQQACIERDRAIATKAQIGHKREATAMATASKYKRENDQLKRQLNQSLEFASIKKVQIHHRNQKFSPYPLRKYSVEHGLEIQKVDDVNYDKVNAYHKDAWLAVYNIHLATI